MRSGFKITLANKQDIEVCLQLDPFITKVQFIERSNQKLIIVAKENKIIIGYLRFMYFWRNLPYLCLIKVVDGRRNEGIGTAMLHFLEDFLKKAGYKQLLSSTDVDEPKPQRWHRKVGFEEVGFIKEINDDGIGELFFLKKLKKNGIVN